MRFFNSTLVISFLLTGLAPSHLLDAADEPATRVWTVDSSIGSPYSKRDGSGPMDLILVEIFRRAAIPAHVVFAPAERGLFNVNAGVDDADGFRSKQLDGTLPHLVCVPEPVITAYFRAYTRRDFPGEIATLADLKPYNVGVLRGRPVLVKTLSHVRQLTEANTQESVFQMLEARRVDVVVSESFDAEAIIQALGYKELMRSSEPVGSANLHLYVHEKNRAFVDRLNAAIREMHEDHFIDRTFTQESLKRENGAPP